MPLKTEIHVETVYANLDIPTILLGGGSGKKVPGTPSEK
jgi:hypothetical protein